MTPEAVIHRYLQVANQSDVDLEVLARLVATDADLLGRWLALLQVPAHPTALLTALKELDPWPLNNLAQEMSPVDEGFRKRINHIYNVWRGGIAQALMRGQANGIVRTDIHPGETAAFLVAAMEGCMGMAKNARDPELLFNCGKSLIGYLESLRVTHSGRPSPR